MRMGPSELTGNAAVHRPNLPTLTAVLTPAASPGRAGLAGVPAAEAEGRTVQQETLMLSSASQPPAHERAQGYVACRLEDPCFVAPSPELRERLEKEAAKARGKGGDLLAGITALAPQPRALGFDDGVIIPPDEFPARHALGARSGPRPPSARRCAAPCGSSSCWSTSPTSRWQATTAALRGPVLLDRRAAARQRQGVLRRGDRRPGRHHRRGRRARTGCRRRSPGTPTATSGSAAADAARRGRDIMAHDARGRRRPDRQLRALRQRRQRLRRRLHRRARRRRRRGDRQLGRHLVAQVDAAERVRNADGDARSSPT